MDAVSCADSRCVLKPVQLGTPRDWMCDLGSRVLEGSPPALTEETGTINLKVRLVSREDAVNSIFLTPCSHVPSAFGR